MCRKYRTAGSSSLMALTSKYEIPRRNWHRSYSCIPVLDSKVPIEQGKSNLFCALIVVARGAGAGAVVVFCIAVTISTLYVLCVLDATDKVHVYVLRTFYLSWNTTYCRQYLLYGSFVPAMLEHSVPGTCHCPAHAEPIADFYWRRDSQDHRLTLVVGTPNRIQGITACACASEPHQVVQLCFHHQFQFQWWPCKFKQILQTYDWCGQMTGNRALEETLKDRRFATLGPSWVLSSNSKLNLQTLPAMIVWFAFPMLASQFRTENAKLKKKTKKNKTNKHKYKNTRLWSLQNNAKERRQLKKCLFVFWSRRARPPPPPKARSSEDM